MKLSKDWKRQFKLVFTGFLGTCLVVTLIFPAFFSYGQTARDLQNKIEQKNEDIAKLEAEIKQYQIQLNDLGKQKSSLAGELKQLDITRKKLVADIAITQNKIDKTNLKIGGLSSQIGSKEELIANDLRAIAENIKKTDEFEQTTLIEILLSKNDFTLVWNDVDNRATVREKIRQTINELREVKSELEDTREETIAAKKELEALKSKLADQKKIVDQNTKDKNKLLTQTKNSEANYQALVADRRAKTLVFEKELRDYESQLKYILDPSSLPGKGVLSWPLDSILITQMFGKTEDGKRLYASGTHNGADFRASIGTPVKAMTDGVVAGTGDTDIQCPGVSFGRFVLIKYNNGLAGTYGHLSLVKVSAGQKVKRGEIVAYSGNTGYSTGPHLHVSLYAKDAVEVKTLPSKSCPGRVLTQPISAINAYLDPLYYLPPYTASMVK
ncbi:hypothetical protein A2933_00055 [Candidatus Nomurabacteria bacterium RIFCSPLOWO2_01_FULL_46_18]|uniref:M23ase beta-sheet core domain-containing protein n=1 Tax=Candidatus Nomurabacteria bacterium RIFCSPLOWO2_01_FULL_46_18 TaxID=1801783 RepID=A0A1F6XEM0_9BACT|nr:MAG: hypothetical protein A2933_00055 [Candidatus Nomurabacteria bacterium RIFCSPLOWO2_01_FULL_46_18]